MTRANSWSPDEEAWLREHYPAMQPGELVEGLLAAFGRERTATAVNQRARVLGLRKADGYRKHHPSAWSAERERWFRAFCPGHTEREISAEHERLFGFPLTEGQIGNAKARYGVRSGTHGGRFERGHEPANKGRTWDEQGIPPEVQERMRATCFKPGEVRERPDGWLRPVGYERTDKDGYAWVKVRDSRVDGIQRNEPGHFNENYSLKHHVEWERANGQPVPPHCMVVFADHDKGNFDPANLVLVPRAAWVRIGQMGMSYSDRETLEACVARAMLHNAIGAKRRELGA